ncbi:MAG: MDR family MFS transporter [Nesterenkonia sp.]|uniref:MDR family MFS transporter n=1 Tax=Nesterenkonia marinintestina TaxID=2979865 RepID=UPI0021C0A80E|nr:MDR family MFS transporter [Nesterenkonia sp. GX14115]MDO5493591.1 MDR family MFS transporter [Nesterenkonia sp.]
MTADVRRSASAAGPGEARAPFGSDPDRPPIVPLFVALVVTMLLAAMSQTVLATALPTVVGELGGVDQMTWVITAFILASTVTMPVYGRISDSVGRRPLLLVAILLFIGGSVAAALSPDVWWLIAARAVQGLGGGGLMILSQTAIADVVPARERGRYMGIMGAVFAVSSVAGPLLGGWLTEGPGWRWVFWMNVPLGLLALAAVAAFLRLPARPRGEGRRTDYAGITLLAAATTGVVLICTWGGHTFAWSSGQILWLGAATLVVLVGFVLVERWAAQPVIPLSLFADRNFLLTTVGALMVGIAMFGAVGYMPTYLQMVTGVDATQAGLMMTPMMGSLLLTSIVAGQLVTRTGRYKVYPVVGTATMALGLWLMAGVPIDAPIWAVCVAMAVFGAGIGLCMQILTLIVQNTVSHRIVGTATAANTFFRQVGATVGSAMVGSLFVQRLRSGVADMPQVSDQLGTGGVNSLTPETVRQLPEATRVPLVEAYHDALLPIFLYMIPLVLVAFVALLLLKEEPLATRVAADDVEEARPTTTGSDRE